MTETYSRDDMARAWQVAHDELCPLSREGCALYHPNPYATLSLPPEPPEGTIVVDKNGEAWQRGKGNEGESWFPTQSDDDYDWEDLLDEFGPLRIAVPLTDDELASVVAALRYGYASSRLDLADRIEGTQP